MVGGKVQTLETYPRARRVEALRTDRHLPKQERVGLTDTPLRDHWIRQVAQVDKRRLGRISADEERIGATCSPVSANVGVHKRHMQPCKRQCWSA